jgi:hypothetical protein
VRPSNAGANFEFGAIFRRNSRSIRDQITQTLLTSSRLILHADRRTGIGAPWAPFVGARRKLKGLSLRRLFAFL